MAAMWLAPAMARAQSDASELFLNAYMTGQQAEKTEAAGKLTSALQKYRYAGSLLDQVQAKFPKWQPLIVDYRKRKISEAIGKLETRIAVEGGGPAEDVEAVPDAGFEGALPSRDDPDPSGSVSPGGGGDVADQVARQIRDRVETLQRDLNEARQQARMERAEKEDLATKLDVALKRLSTAQVTEAEAKARVAQVEDALANAQQDAASTEEADALRQQVATLREELQQARIERDAADDQNREFFAKLANSRGRTVAIMADRDAIAKERDQALAELGEAKKAQVKVEQLLTDNADLMAKLEQAQTRIQEFGAETEKKDTEIASLTKDLGDVKERLAEAEKENKAFADSMNELQDKLEATNQQLAEAKQNAETATEDQKKLTRENEVLRGIVLRQLKEQARRDQSKKLVMDELKRLDLQSDVLNKQLTYLAQPIVKLTDDEKALFKGPQLEILDAEGGEASIEISAPKDDSATPERAPLIGDAGPAPAPTPEPLPEVSDPLPPSATAPESGDPLPMPETTEPASVFTEPPGSIAESEGLMAPGSPQVETQTKPKVPEELLPLARQAKEQFERDQFRESEKIYEKMLAKAPNNIYILSNLAVTRFRQGKMRQAEETFKKAIAVAPEDAFSHSTLGIVLYSQGKYDEAVDELTKALAINPKNAVAHNYLGITASQKGWYDAALKELETAVTLDPNYADAHFNLAVIYATGPKPMKELARKHYKRAVELGAEADPQLEKLLDE